jgi:hypothetical protein
MVSFEDGCGILSSTSYLASHNSTYTQENVAICRYASYRALCPHRQLSNPY